MTGALDAVGPDGTLLLPALSYERVGAHHPEFDALRTPSNVGAIPEHFRLRPGSMRSVHPTHSICGVGPLARRLLSEHDLDATPVGEHSPLAKLPAHEGQILFLGCGLGPNTSMHGVEETVEPPYLFGKAVTYRLILADGTVGSYTCRAHNFFGWRQRYDRLAHLLRTGVELREGQVLDAPSHLVESRAMWVRAKQALLRDPLHFVERAAGH